MTRVDVGDLALNVERWGHGPPLALLHGFTGAAAGWAEIAERLAPEHAVLAIDIVGHGRSDAPAELERYRMRRAVDDLVAVLRAQGYERATWLGYSMGGRVALQLAVHRPDAVDALVLESATPGLATAEERTARVASDEALATRIERDGVPAFVDYWQALPLFASQAGLPAERRAAIRAGRLANSARGLAQSLRGMGTGAQQAVHGRLAEVGVPALLLTGSLDEKFTAIAAEMARALPDATMHVIDGAGHAAHVERPDEFTTHVLAFLRRAHSAQAASAER